MSLKAKDLQYEKQEPSFLRKLKEGYSELDGRHNVQIARPKRDRLKTGDDDDDPVIVDEQGETVAKDEFERRAKGTGSDNTPAKENTTDAEFDNHETAGKISGREDEGERQKVTEIGVVKKRKVGKLVGADEHEQETFTTKPRTTEDEKVHIDVQTSIAKKPTGLTKKRGKKIKLSFDEPDT